MSLTEIQRLKSWLQSSDALLFCDTLRARSYTATLEAGELLKQSIVKKDKRGMEAEGHAALAGLLEAVIDEMNRVANDESLMVKLSAVAPRNETETEATTEE